MRALLSSSSWQSLHDRQLSTLDVGGVGGVGCGGGWGVGLGFFGGCRFVGCVGWFLWVLLLGGFCGWGFVVGGSRSTWRSRPARTRSAKSCFRGFFSIVKTPAWSVSGVDALFEGPQPRADGSPHVRPLASTLTVDRLRGFTIRSAVRTVQRARRETGRRRCSRRTGRGYGIGRNGSRRRRGSSGRQARARRPITRRPRARAFSCPRPSRAARPRRQLLVRSSPNLRDFLQLRPCRCRPRNGKAPGATHCCPRSGSSRTS